MNLKLPLILQTLLFVFMFTAGQAGTISVSATGVMPSNPFSPTTDTWTFSGTFSDSLPDVFPIFPGGIFEFGAADLLNLDFTIGGNSIGFLEPTPFINSGIVVGTNTLNFGLFLDPTDPYFGGGYSNVIFTISMIGGPFASDPEDLTTLGSFGSASLTTSLIYQPVGGSFSSTNNGAGSLAVTAPAVVPLPASLGFFAIGLFSLFGLGIGKSKKRV